MAVHKTIHTKLLCCAAQLYIQKRECRPLETLLHFQFSVCYKGLVQIAKFKEAMQTPDFGNLQRNPMDSKHLVNLLHEQFFFPGTSQQPIFCQTPQLEIFQIVQSTPLKQEINKACFTEMKNHGPDCWFVPQLLLLLSVPYSCYCCFALNVLWRSHFGKKKFGTTICMTKPVWSLTMSVNANFSLSSSSALTLLLLFFVFFLCFYFLFFYFLYFVT